MQYHLRTLLIVLALGPPVLAGWWLIISRDPDLPSIIALIICLLIGAGAAGPILFARHKQRS
jgi:hypothetical protein